MILVLCEIMIAIAVAFGIYIANLGVKLGYFFSGVMAVMGLLALWNELGKKKSSKVLDSSLPIKARIDSDAIEIRVPHVIQRYDWNAYTEYRESKNLFLIKRSFDRHFQIIPKRAFSNSDIPTFLQLLSSKVPQR